VYKETLQTIKARERSISDVGRRKNGTEFEDGFEIEGCFLSSVAKPLSSSSSSKSC